MKVVFMGVFYYGGPVRHLYQIFKIYRGIANIFMKAGIECFYFSKQHEVFPEDKTINEKEFNDMLPDIDLVFIWNGGLCLEKIIAEKCIKQGTPVYFSELGWLPQMNTFYFDTKGVNYASSITDWKYDNITLTKEERLFLNSNLSYYHNIVIRKTKPAPKLPDDGYVFVPFQVENDSQILNHSPHIKKMQELVDYIDHFIQDNVIFKMHPKDDPGKIKMPDRFTLVKGGTTHDYLPNCKYVVTINSTVGLEALTYYKPVITLGNAFYSGRGLSYAVNSENEMYNAIFSSKKGNIAVEIVDKFLHYIFKKQWHISQLEDANKVMSLIYRLTD